jgi:hypothetical protein
MVSCVGEDSAGQRIRSALHERGISTDYTATDPIRPTGSVHVFLRGGGPAYQIAADAAWDYLAPNAALDRLARSCDAVCYGSLAQRSPVSRMAIRGLLENAAHAVRLFDANLRRNSVSGEEGSSAEIVETSCQLATIIKANGSELSAMCQLLGIGQGEDDGDSADRRRMEMFLARFPARALVLTFRSNKNGLSRPRYRYQNPGGTIGGPLLIPGTRFNRSRKLFFFSEDYLHNQSVSAVAQFNMPMALECNRDFSQTVTTTGVRIPIKDPTTGQPFPGALIPASRISLTGSTMMKLFPLPFTADPSGQRQFNTQYQNVVNNPREDRILRLDYSIGQKTTSFVRLAQDYFGRDGYGTPASPAGGAWHQFKTGYGLPSAGAVVTVIHTFRPNLINEFTAGVNASHQHLYPDDPAYANSQLPLKGPNGQVITLPKFFNFNPFNVLPNINFGSNGAQSPGQGVTNAPGFGTDTRWPFEATEHIYNLTDNVTWVKGPHVLKAGLYLEYEARGTVNFATYNSAGTYWFGSDTANPIDTGYAYSNLLLGSVQAYGEDNQRLVAHGRYHHVEWFAQDTWKVSRRLTLDLGMRFQIIAPFENKGATLNVFAKEQYDVKRSGELLYPAAVNGERVALNPLTGATYVYPRQGSFDPASYAGSESPYSGMRSYHDSFFTTPPVLFGPRAGFAWDVFGNGMTAIRGGFGIFYQNPIAVDTIANLATTPPLFLAPLFFNTTSTTLLSTQGFFSPQNVNGGSQDYKNPTT